MHWRAFQCAFLGLIIGLWGLGASLCLAQPATQPATQPQARGRGATTRPHTLSGEFKTHPAFHSNFLTRDRDVIVYLPPGYAANPQKRYPVFYMHDGQNLFDAATSYAGEWKMDETANALIEKGEIEPLIIVGIWNTPDRMREYVQANGSGRYASTAAQGDAYGKFIVEELKPFIDSNYRTLTDVNNTALGGSSLGGLISMYLGMKHPSTFGKLAVVSPSVFWADKDIVKQVNELPAKLNLRIWLDIGTKEGSNPDSTRDDTRMLRDALISKGWKLDQDLKYMEAEGEAHNEGAWSRRADQILQFLFSSK